MIDEIRGPVTTEEERRKRLETPVYEIDFCHEGDLPGIFTTRPFVDSLTGKRTGRTYVERFPKPGDTDGYMALREAWWYYDEGMKLEDSADKLERIAHFQAAEILELLAIERGNAHASLSLGYIYAYDRCCGMYWEEALSDAEARDARAYECFQAAADAGYVEALYKLGDLTAEGRGCEPDAQEAFRLFKLAYDYAEDGGPAYLWGGAALRLATSYEEGAGCPQSFADAAVWYERARTGLGIAVRDGDWFYTRRLAAAEAGLKRMRQELSGEY